ncbi:hypothetical protein [uncultured Jatrophihabitans sp.]|uniref:hypothetical protein n=1 Tax=uncultured Jatrophihabitans sp. TaxID=1610747 RepID=UPI0035CC64A4
MLHPVRDHRAADRRPQDEASDIRTVNAAGACHRTSLPDAADRTLRWSSVISTNPSILGSRTITSTTVGKVTNSLRRSARIETDPDRESRAGCRSGGENAPGLPQHRLVDHRAFEDEDARMFGSRYRQPARPVDQLLTRSVSGPDDTDLGRVNAGLATKPLATASSASARTPAWSGMSRYTESMACLPWAAGKQHLGAGPAGDVAVAAVDPAAGGVRQTGDDVLGAPHEGQRCSRWTQSLRLS